MTTAAIIHPIGPAIPSTPRKAPKAEAPAPPERMGVSTINAQYPTTPTVPNTAPVPKTESIILSKNLL